MHLAPGVPLSSLHPNSPPVPLPPAPPPPPPTTNLSPLHQPLSVRHPPLFLASLSLSSRGCLLSLRSSPALVNLRLSPCLSASCESVPVLTGLSTGRRRQALRGSGGRALNDWQILRFSRPTGGKKRKKGEGLPLMKTFS